jgi:hypothetical protein
MRYFPHWACSGMNAEMIWAFSATVLDVACSLWLGNGLLSLRRWQSQELR